MFPRHILQRASFLQKQKNKAQPKSAENEFLPFIRHFKTTVFQNKQQEQSRNSKGGCFILGIGTSNPERVVTRAEALAFAAALKPANTTEATLK